MRGGLGSSKFNNSRLVLAKALKVYSSLIKGLKPKVRKFGELILTFGKVTEKYWVGGGLFPHPF